MEAFPNSYVNLENCCPRESDMPPLFAAPNSGPQIPITDTIKTADPASKDHQYSDTTAQMSRGTTRGNSLNSSGYFQSFSGGLSFLSSGRESVSGGFLDESINSQWPTTGNIFDSASISARNSLDEFRQFRNIIKSIQTGVPSERRKTKSVETSTSPRLSLSSSFTKSFINSETGLEYVGAMSHPFEADRLEALRRLKLEEADQAPYDNLTRLASNVTECPISCVSLVEADKQWFKSHHGFDATETTRDISLCAHTILHDTDIFEIEDATLDDWFRNSPAIGPGKAIFYAGVPLKSTNGLPMGALCVSDSKPKKLNKQQRINLLMIAKQAQTEIELRELVLKCQEQAALSRKLLLNVLPSGIVDRLTKVDATDDLVIADSFDEATVIFADIVNFTHLASETRVEDLIQTIGRLFTKFDKCTHAAGATKIKTIGDGYLAVTGVPSATPCHAQNAIECARLFLKAVSEMNAKYDQNLQIRIGIHSGPLMAGVVGFEKFTYDIFGDCVNIASRMEATGIPGRIHISSATFELIKENYQCQKRSELTKIKGKGTAQTYIVSKRIENVTR